MEITAHVPQDFNRATFDELSTDSQCKVLALYEVAYLLELHHLKPLTPKEFYNVYDMDANSCYDTCTSFINAIVQGNIKETRKA